MTVLNTDTLADTPYQVTVSQNLGMNPTEINHRVNRVRNYDAFDFKHYKYKCKECLVGFRLQQTPQSYLPTKIIIDKSALRNAVYLPYKDHNSTSVRLSIDRYPAIRYFFTDNLSGCAVFIDKRDGGHFFAYHVNTHLHSGEESKRMVPSWQHTEATHRLNAMHTISSRDQRLHLNRRTRYACTKDIYLGGADDLKKKGKKFGWLGHKTQILKKDLIAGTCVIGVRVRGGNDWTFYYQTWGRLDRKGVSTDLHVIDSGTFRNN